MCGNCGCQTSASPNTPQKIQIHQNILATNERYAAQNRALFQHQLVLNVLSSPGAGKTALIQRLLQTLTPSKSPLKHHSKPLQAGVIVGDLATERDAQRLRQTGAPAVQITTGTLCHLEAHSVAQAAQQLELDRLDWVIIENVGNLVCPAAYDLGEDLRIVLMSVTEGEDKPLKYPTTFKSAHAVVISKIDIASAVGFKREEALSNLHHIAPQAQIFELSATTGEGVSMFLAYLLQAFQQVQDSPGKIMNKPRVAS